MADPCVGLIKDLDDILGDNIAARIMSLRLAPSRSSLISPVFLSRCIPIGDQLAVAGVPSSRETYTAVDRNKLTPVA